MMLPPFSACPYGLSDMGFVILALTSLCKELMRIHLKQWMQLKSDREEQIESEFNRTKNDSK